MSKKAIAHLASISPYSQSKFHNTPKLPKELPDDYEARTWAERIHVDSEGRTYVPPMAFKNCIAEIAKFLGEQVPGRGKATWTKHFEAGILCVTPVLLQSPTTGNFVLKSDWEGDWGFYPADGVRGSGKRVMKCYPVIPAWIGTCEFLIYDDTITESVFAKHLEQAGRLIGVGRFRPRNNGYFGRFKVEELRWEDDI
jgi:hypothetical protein